jgi:hypothetical protein
MDENLDVGSLGMAQNPGEMSGFGSAKRWDVLGK